MDLDDSVLNDYVRQALEGATNDVGADYWLNPEEVYNAVFKRFKRHLKGKLDRSSVPLLKGILEGLADKGMIEKARVRKGNANLSFYRHGVPMERYITEFSDREKSNVLAALYIMDPDDDGTFFSTGGIRKQLEAPVSAKKLKGMLEELHMEGKLERVQIADPRQDRHFWFDKQTFYRAAGDRPARGTPYDGNTAGE